MAYECVDRHVVDGYGDKVALHYFGENEEHTLTYRELKEKVGSVGNRFEKARG